MSPVTIDWLSQIKHLIPKGGRVLEIGSKDFNGSVRNQFKDAKEYIGIDIQEGENVDLVMAAEDIDKLKGDFDIIINMNLFEHDINWWVTLQKINKKLKKGGLHIFVVPTFNFPVHRYPKDYYRFGEDAVREVIFDGFEILDLRSIPTKRHHLTDKPINDLIHCIGRKK